MTSCTALSSTPTEVTKTLTDTESETEKKEMDKDSGAAAAAGGLKHLEDVEAVAAAVVIAEPFVVAEVLLDHETLIN